MTDGKKHKTTTYDFFVLAAWLVCPAWPLVNFKRLDGMWLVAAGVDGRLVAAESGCGDEKVEASRPRLKPLVCIDMPLRPEGRPIRRGLFISPGGPIAAMDSVMDAVSSSSKRMSDTCA